MANALQCVVRGSYITGVPTRSMFTFEDINEFPTSGFVAALEAYFTAVYAPVIGITTTDWSTDSVDVNRLTARLSAPVTSFPFIVRGTTGGDSLPPSDAYIVVGKTNVKKTLGRKFLPGVPEIRQAIGTIDNTARAALDVFGGLWVAPLTVGAFTLTPGVYNRKTSIFHPFFAYRVDTYTATQRRRTAQHR
jgi:hypothetical protein